VTHKLRKAWLAVLIIIGILTTMVPMGFAATPSRPDTLTDDEAIVLMQSYGIVKGDDTGNLRLEDRITRAQAAAIFVRAMNRSDLAQVLKDTKEFNDTFGHWANGEIAMAKRLNLMKGDGGAFRPEANITYAELMTVMLRMVGREPAGPWNADTIMTTAADLGIAPPSIDPRLLGNVPAVRGTVFKALALTLTTIPLADGSTLLKELDQTAPVLTVDSIPATSTANSITVTGKAIGAWKVFVNGSAATMSGVNFTATVSLSGGSNAITVDAVDFAGNKASHSATVARGGDPAKIEVTGPATVAANGTITVKATAYDASGIALPAAVIGARVEGNIGTYDAITGKFQAGSTAGTGSIKFNAGTTSKTFDLTVTGLANTASQLRIREVNDGRLLSVGKFQTVAVEVLDEDGNLLTMDSGRTITLTSSSSDLRVASTTATTNGGVASYTLTPSKEGSYTVTATASNLTATSADVNVGTATRIVLIATPDSMVATSTNQATIRAQLQDEKGDPVTNSTDDDIILNLTATGTDGSLTDSFMMIRKGTNSSIGSDGHFVPGTQGGTVTVTGTVTSSHTYTVQPVRISLTQLQIGSASRFEIIGGGTKLPDTEVPLTIRVTDRDGNQITTGSYAFQVQVTTSNTQDTVTSGLPETASVTIGSMPVAYGGGTNSVVGRTTNGSASIKFQYGKSGRVTLKVIGVAASSTAYDADGTPGNASSGTSLTGEEKVIIYDDLTNGTAAIELAWDMPTLNVTGQEYGILSANNTTTAKLKAYLVDRDGGRRPSGDGKMTITKTGTGSRVTSTEATVRAGVAEFTVVSTDKADLDTYTVTYTTLTATTTSQTKNARPDRPSVWSIFSESGNTTRIGISDTYMEVNVADLPAGYGVIKVYAVSNNKLVYTSPVMQLSGTTSIRVPKSNLAVGADRYKVTVHNGYQESLASDPYPTDPTDLIVNARSVKIDITAVYYDAKTKLLKVNASGVSSSNGGVINPENLTLRKGSAEIPLTGATCTLSSNFFSCDLTAWNLTPSSYSGAWFLDTRDGWYVRNGNGDSAQADEKLDNNYVGPFANITGASIDFAAGKVTLHGENLNRGTIYLANLYINDPALKLGTGSVKATSPTEVTFTLSTALATTVRDTVKGAGNRLYGLDGWLRDSSSNENAALDTPAPIMASVAVGWVTYNKNTDTLTINGTGLQGGTVDLSKLVIRKRNGDPVLRLVPNTADPATPNGEVILNLQNGVLKDNKVEIKLTSAHATTLEATGNDANVFFSSDDTNPASNSGWFLDSEGRYGTALRGSTYLLNW
jgi:hypothetical protein